MTRCFLYLYSTICMDSFPYIHTWKNADACCWLQPDIWGIFPLVFLMILFDMSPWASKALSVKSLLEEDKRTPYYWYKKASILIKKLGLLDHSESGNSYTQTFWICTDYLLEFFYAIRHQGSLATFNTDTARSEVCKHGYRFHGVWIAGKLGIYCLS